MQQQLSKYLQKYILNLIISYFNNKKKTFIKVNKEREIDLFLFNLLNVCWYWFDVIKEQSNLLPFKQFIKYNNNNQDDENNKYSIFQINNIKFIYINERDMNLYSDKEIIELTTTTMNLPFNKYSNLKRIIINCTGVKNIKKSIEIIKLYNNEKEQQKLKISITDKDSYDDQISEDLKRFTIDKVKMYSIYITQTIDFELSNSINLLKDLKSCPTFINFNKYFNLIFKRIYYNDTNNNNLKNALLKTKEYRFIRSSLSIEQLYYLLKLSPNLKALTIGICYDNLIYQLERLNKFNGEEEEGGIEIGKCKYNCGDIFNYNINEFKEHWEFIYKSIKDSKKLKTFKIIHRCPLNDNKYETCPIGEFQKLEEYPIYTIQTLGTMLKFNNSIETLIIDSFHTPQLLEFIFTTNNHDNFENKTITRLNSSFRVSYKNKLLFKQIKENIYKIKNNNNNNNQQLRIEFYDPDSAPW